jgi:hypothetical protein
MAYGHRFPFAHHPALSFAPQKFPLLPHYRNQNNSIPDPGSGLLMQYSKGLSSSKGSIIGRIEYVL